MKYEKHRALLLPALTALALAACSGGKSGGNIKTLDAAQARSAAAIAVNDAAARDCPWPADLDHYESTTLAPRQPTTPPVRLGVFDEVRQGCAIMTFTVDENGLITGANVVSANPPAFAAVAPKALRWSNFVAGATSLTEFIVRLGAAPLPGGGAMIAMQFKDSTVDLEIPP
jgi:hypothetical protein